MKIGFLHTSKSHIKSFDNILSSLYPKIGSKHYVNKELLDFAIKYKKTDSIGFKNIITDIKKEKVDLIICTCSTYGEEVEKYNNVFRIDKPICEFIVNNYTKIGLVYTAKSTAIISKKLLKSVSKKYLKEITIIECDCTEQWTHFENENQAVYEKNISNSIKKIEHKVEVVFLAQASMEGVKKLLPNFKTDVFSSPRFGVEQIIKTNLSC